MQLIDFIISTLDMAPKRKDKGKAPAGDEEESSHRNVRGANSYISPPPDPSVRPVLRLGGHREYFFFCVSCNYTLIAVIVIININAGLLMQGTQS